MENKTFCLLSLAFFFLSSISFSQDLTCKDFQEGVFYGYSQDVDGLKWIIIRNGNHQTEKTIKSSENKLGDTIFVNCLDKKVNLSLLTVETVDKQHFDEGLIYTIKTKDSSYVLLNCLYNSNPNLLTQKEYVVLDSIIIKNDYYSYRGVDTTSGNYWRRDGNISYIKVKSKDTIKYNMIFDDERFLTKR